jgi:hypothetical protein
VHRSVERDGHAAIAPEAARAPVGQDACAVYVRADRRVSRGRAFRIPRARDRFRTVNRKNVCIMIA